MKLLYLAYLLKTTNYQELRAFIKFISEKKKQSESTTIQNMLSDFKKYNTAFSDYFFLEFFDKSDEEKSAYASTWYMYKFQKKMNDKAFIKYFKNKKLFYKRFSSYINHRYFIPEDHSVEDFKSWTQENDPAALMVKQSDGQAGAGLEKINIIKDENGNYQAKNMSLSDFYNYAQAQGYDLFDTFINQHPVIDLISPNALSTIRVISILDAENNVHILKPLIRMSSDSFVDNFHMGGISMGVDEKSGRLLAPMFFRDPRKPKNQTKHPATGKEVIGIHIPHWDKVLPMIEKAALEVPEVRTVGWDVVITKEGPGLLEGNHNWDKTHYEKIHQEGLKQVLNSINL